jgi:uncharacterized delta-60 repeat protein
LDGSGRIVVSASYDYSPGAPGQNSSDFLVARFNANGSLDTTFGAAHSGWVKTDIQSGSTDLAYALALQSDGKIVVGGSAAPQTGGEIPAVVRYNPDGSLDSTFGQGGVTLIDADPNQSEVRAAVVQPDGKILLAGMGNAGTVLLIRLNANGTPDASYGPAGTGVSSTSIGAALQIAAMDLQPDGRAVVAGRIGTFPAGGGEVDYFALTRFLASSASPAAVQVGSFTAAPNPVAAGSPVTLTAGGVTTTNAGATVTKGAFYAEDSAGTEQFLGYGTANADGTWTLTFTADLVLGPYTVRALAADSTGAVSDPLTADLNVT